MHHHDIEIIMALAEGSLDPEAAAAAQIDVASCAECSLDLEMQKSALASLDEIPQAALTEMESARLRRNVRQELGITRPTAETVTPKRRRMPLAALGTAAAVLVAVVVAAPALNMIGGSSDDSEEPLEQALTTTAAAFQADAANPSDLELGGAAEGIAEASQAPATTFAAATTTLAPPEAPSLVAYFADVPDLADLLEAVADAEFDADNSRSLARSVSGDTTREGQLDESILCSSITISNEDNFIEAFQIARGQIEDREVVYVVYLAENLEESALIVHASDNCEELGRAVLEAS